MAHVIDEQISHSSQGVHWRDYLELCKPNVVALMILTSVVGMFLATDGMVPLIPLVVGNLGIALLAGAAAAVNHVADRHIDALMARTEGRPVARGRLGSTHALLFAGLLGGAGFLMLMLWVNALTAWLTLATLIGYAFVYTVYLKRATPQNIVIGGLAGATPPLLGWTAVTGSLEANAFLLVLIIFAWTPPHFWALCLHRKAEYQKASIPMLPVTHGEAYTRLQILLYTVVLVLVAVLPYLVGMSGLVYLIGSSLLGGVFLFKSWQLYRQVRDNAAIGLFGYSITYLMLLFVVLLVDHYLMIG